MSKNQPDPPKTQTGSPPEIQDPGSVPGPSAQGTSGHVVVEEQGQGQLEAEDFYSENHFVDEPDERNLK